MQIESNSELVEQIYVLIHTFLSKRLKNDLLNDNIEVVVTTDSSIGLDISIDIDLEISPFSEEDAQKLSQEAVEFTLEKLDKEICQICDKIKKQP